MDSLPARFISLPARFISMGVWVTGVRDAWEDFDVVVNKAGILVGVFKDEILFIRVNRFEAG